jgi:hypothetical protein
MARMVAYISVSSLLKNLDDVAIRRRAEDLEDVRARWQDSPPRLMDGRNRNGFAERELDFAIPFIGQ